MSKTENKQELSQDQAAAGNGSAEQPLPNNGPDTRPLPELLAVRRAKALQLLPPGETQFPYSYPDTKPIQEIHAHYSHLAAGEETEDIRRVAGRLAARRGQGKAAFMDLVDRSGRIQLHARLDVLGEEAFQRLLNIDLGDLLGVQGTIMRSN